MAKNSAEGIPAAKPWDAEGARARQGAKGPIGAESPGGEKIRSIAVEGPIGVGKTSLAKILARVFNAKEELEDTDNNPFIAKFYENIKAYAFQTQVYFLLTRYKHQQSLLQLDLFSKMVISDYIFEKDRIFAYANLTDDELILYEKLYSMLKINIPNLIW